MTDLKERKREQEKQMFQKLLAKKREEREKGK